MSTALQQQPKKEVLVQVKGSLDKFRDKLETALGKLGDVDQEIQSVLAVVAASERLQQCSPESIAMAAYHAASLGLSVNPNLGLAYLVPRWNGKTKKNECSFQISYRGHRNKVLETGYVQALEAYLVYDKDKFAYQLGSKPVIHHEPCLEENRGEVKLIYAIARIGNNNWIAKVMTKKDIEEHRKFSQSPTNGPWVTHWNQMALKTVIIALCKQLPVGTKALRELYQIIQNNEQVSDADYTQPPMGLSLPPSPSPFPLLPPSSNDSADDPEPEDTKPETPVLEAEIVPEPQPDERQQLLSKVYDLHTAIKEKDKKAEALPKDVDQMNVQALTSLLSRLSAIWARVS